MGNISLKVLYNSCQPKKQQLYCCFFDIFSKELYNLYVII